MSTSTPTTARTVAPRPALAVLAVLAVGLAQATLAVLSLATASGVTYLGGSSYETEFAHPGWWWASLLLAVPVGLLSWWRPRIAAPLVLAAAVPQLALAHEVVQRYDESGWSDGLEVLAYVVAVFVVLVLAVAALAGALLGRASTSRGTANADGS